MLRRPGRASTQRGYLPAAAPGRHRRAPFFELRRQGPQPQEDRRGPRHRRVDRLALLSAVSRKETDDEGSSAPPLRPIKAHCNPSTSTRRTSTSPRGPLGSHCRITSTAGRTRLPPRPRSGSSCSRRCLHRRIDARGLETAERDVRSHPDRHPPRAGRWRGHRLTESPGPDPKAGGAAPRAARRRRDGRGARRGGRARPATNPPRSGIRSTASARRPRLRGNRLARPPGRSEHPNR